MVFEWKKMLVCSMKVTRYVKGTLVLNTGVGLQSYAAGELVRG